MIAYYYLLLRFFDGGGIKFGQLLQQCCFYKTSNERRQLIVKAGHLIFCLSLSIVNFKLSIVTICFEQRRPGWRCGVYLKL